MVWVAQMVLELYLVALNLVEANQLMKEGGVAACLVAETGLSMVVVVGENLA